MNCHVQLSNHLLIQLIFGKHCIDEIGNGNAACADWSGQLPYGREHEATSHAGVIVLTRGTSVFGDVPWGISAPFKIRVGK